MSARRLVAIVEDNDSVATSLALAVEGLQDVEAVVAHHPDFALRLFTGGDKVSALLTDFGLPGMDGLELIARIRAIPAYADLPVVMITAGDVPEGAPPAAMPNAILSKPFSPREVCRVLASLLH
jgi:CheY-like chemotaxis protein